MPNKLTGIFGVWICSKCGHSWSHLMPYCPNCKANEEDHKQEKKQKEKK